MNSTSNIPGYDDLDRWLAEHYRRPAQYQLVVDGRFASPVALASDRDPHNAMYAGFSDGGLLLLDIHEQDSELRRQAAEYRSRVAAPVRVHVAHLDPAVGSVEFELRRPSHDVRVLAWVGSLRANGLEVHAGASQDLCRAGTITMDAVGTRPCLFSLWVVEYPTVLDYVTEQLRTALESKKRERSGRKMARLRPLMHENTDVEHEEHERDRLLDRAANVAVSEVTNVPSWTHHE